MAAKKTYSANITGDFSGLVKDLMKDAEPTIYVEALDGRMIPVCRLVKDPDCPEELFEAVIRQLL